MSDVTYTLELYSNVGRKLAVIDSLASLSAARTVNGGGSLTVVVPAEPLEGLARRSGLNVARLSDTLPYYWLVVWRRSGARRRLLLDTAWLILAVDLATGDGGAQVYTLSAEDVLFVLSTRDARYYSGSAFTDKSDFADDMAKDVVRENMVSSTDTDRNVSSDYLSVAADTGDAPTVARTFSYREVLAVLQDIAAAAAEAGTDLFFDLEPIGFDPLKLEFRTYTGQRGADVSEAVEFSRQRGNLGRDSYRVDYLEEWNAVLAAGQGLGNARVTRTAEDTTRSGRSPWSRRERFRDGGSVPPLAGSSGSDPLQDDADAELEAGKPRRTFEADGVSVPGSEYGLHWNYGDKVRAVSGRDAFECWISTVQVVYRPGVEAISVRLRNAE